MENDDRFKIASVHENVRLCVIENTIFIEELASRVLGNILGIEWKTSKSFGSNASSLSFSQKLQLIQDIKDIDKEDLKKIRCIGEIRNKFAHVSDINSFEKLFSGTAVGQEMHRLFLQWYFDKDGLNGIDPGKLEFVYRICFYMLVNSVVNILLKISDDHLFNLGVHEGKKEVKEQLWQICLSILPPEQKLEILTKFYELYPE